MYCDTSGHARGFALWACSGDHEGHDDSCPRIFYTTTDDGLQSVNRKMARSYSICAVSLWAPRIASAPQHSAPPLRVPLLTARGAPCDRDLRQYRSAHSKCGTATLSRSFFVRLLWRAGCSLRCRARSLTPLVTDCYHHSRTFLAFLPTSGTRLVVRSAVPLDLEVPYFDLALCTDGRARNMSKIYCG